MENAQQLIRSILIAPVKGTLFLADCLLKPRPWDSAAWTRDTHPRPR